MLVLFALRQVFKALAMVAVLAIVLSLTQSHASAGEITPGAFLREAYFAAA